ncbi:hypothetical protein HQ865_15245 [Mucilaginibacter mali]|uniref:Type II secretion system protein n=1 Tax=Mucilaginibacter mali TaxID=2740462 RepID=A0A7D4Q8Y4_9SPHI|nr:hypothetical protein [Mucilaginibacter mali]QKJ31051.1 hypothetical protein HQ865_15245 [Mucilaginibacter mali]
MAGTKLKPGKRVQASSLLEVIVAMLIIVVIFGIALGIFANITRSSVSVKQLKARAILNDICTRCEDSTAVESKIFYVDHWKVEQEIKIYEAEPALNELDLAIYDENMVKITELKKLIILK